MKRITRQHQEQPEQEDYEQDIEQEIKSFKQLFYFKNDVELLMTYIKKPSLISQIQGMVGLQSLATQDDVEYIKAVVDGDVAPYLIKAIRKNQHPYLVSAAFNILEEISRQDIKYFVNHQTIQFMFEIIKEIDHKDKANQDDIQKTIKIIQIIGNMADERGIENISFLKEAFGKIQKLLEKYPNQPSIQESGYHTLILMCKTNELVKYEHIHLIMKFLLDKLFSDEQIVNKSEFIEAFLIKVKDFCKERLNVALYNDVFFTKIMELLIQKNYCQSKKMVSSIYYIIYKKIRPNKGLIQKLVKNGLMEQICLTIQRGLFESPDEDSYLIHKILICVVKSSHVHAHAYMKNSRLISAILNEMGSRFVPKFTYSAMNLFGYLVKYGHPQIVYNFYAKTKIVTWFLRVLYDDNIDKQWMVRFLNHLFNALKIGKEVGKKDDQIGRQFVRYNGPEILQEYSTDEDQQVSELCSRIQLLYIDSMPQE